jgi:hypothetical protein
MRVCSGAQLLELQRFRQEALEGEVPQLVAAEVAAATPPASAASRVPRAHAAAYSRRIPSNANSPLPFGLSYIFADCIGAKYLSSSCWSVVRGGVGAATP